jgi:ribokinase
MSTPSIAVIGSLNIDFITRTPRVPGPGETLTANSFTTGFGGKGANQAVACARLASQGTKVAMVGNVGDDNFGRDYFEALGKEGINADGVSTVKGETTGAANIVVEEETGENRIMFTPGANVAFSKEYDQGWDLVPSDAGIVVFQLEIPIDVVCLWEDFVRRIDGKDTRADTTFRSYTTCILLASKESTPCLTRHLLFHSLRPRTKTSTH